MTDQLDPQSYEKNKIDRTYAFPANYKEALLHSRATKFGLNSAKMKNGQTTPICPCCQNYVNTIEIPLCYQTAPKKIVQGEQQFMLDTGTSLYFTFIKIFLICDGFNLLTSISGHYCSKNTDQCSGNLSSFVSGYNKHADEDMWSMNIQDYLNIGVTIASIIFFFICRKKLYKINAILQRTEISQDEFSLYMQGFPQFIYQEQDTKQQIQYEYEFHIHNKIHSIIKDWVNKVYSYKNQDQIKDQLQKDFYKNVIAKNKGNIYQIVVNSITLCFNLQQTSSLDSLRSNLMDQFIQDQTVDLQTLEKSELAKHIPNKIDIINTQYINLSRKMAQDKSAAFNLSHFVGKGFVTFQYQHYRNYMEQRYLQQPDFFKINGKTIHMQRPSVPKDIFWMNLRVTTQERTKIIIQTFIVIIVLLVFSLGALVLISAEQKIGINKINSKYTSNSQNAGTNQDTISANYTAGDKIMYYFWIALLPIITNVLNFGISTAIQRLTEAQYHKTQTHKTSSLIIKNVLSRFLNTTVIYYILSLINSEESPLSPQGYVPKVMGLVGVSYVIQGITEIFRPKQVLQFITNKLSCLSCISNIKIAKDSNGKQKELQRYFQIQLNKKLQLPEFDFVDHYTFYLTMIYLVSFYALVVPVSIFAAIIIFTTQYWLDKYNLFRRSSCSKEFNFFLTKLIWKSLQYSLLIFAIGAYIFAGAIRTNSSNTFTYINIGNIFIAALYVFIATIGPEKLERKFFQQNQDFYSLPYSYYYNQKQIKNTYWTQNPATLYLDEADLNNKDRQIKPPVDDYFIQPTFYDNYLNISEDQIQKKFYGKHDVEYYDNYDIDSDDSSQDDNNKNQQSEHP